MTVAQLGTTAGDKEDDYDVLDDNHPLPLLISPKRSRRHTLFLFELLMLPIL